jgi:hypothetical protein
MHWRARVLVLGLAASISCQPVARREANLPVLVVDAKHTQLLDGGFVTPSAYSVAPGPGFELDASRYDLRLPTIVPKGVTGPNCIQVVRSGDAIYNIPWSTETRRYAITAQTAIPAYGSAAFKPLAVGETVVVAIGHLRERVAAETNDAVVPFWVGLVEVKDGP